MNHETIETWRSDWFWIDSYEPSPGRARLVVGPVGEVVAVISRRTWDGGEVDTFFIRWDPIRHAVELIVRTDVGEPASLEGSVTVTEELEGQLTDAAEEWSPEPETVFTLLVGSTEGLEVRPASEDERNAYNLVPAAE